MTTTERSRWLLLVLALVVALGAGNGLALYRLAEVQSRQGEIQRQQDDDMCELIGTLLPTAGPSPSPGSALESQRRATTQYRDHRCR